MDKRLIIGRKKPKGKRIGRRIIGLGPMLIPSRSARKDYCSRQLTLESLARAEKAQSVDKLFLVDDLHCECGERVGARQSPMGSYLVPTLHYPYKAPPSSTTETRSGRKAGPALMSRVPELRPREG